MSTITLPFLVTLMAGLAVLFFGRQLFWLFVGVIGFATAFEIATQWFSLEPAWVALVVALVVGVVGALLAIFLQYAAIGIAGFLAGGYVINSLLSIIDAPMPNWLPGVLIVAGGVIGALVLVLLFDWALIGLSAVTGASLLVQTVRLDPALQIVAFLILVLVGIAFQITMLPPSQRRSRRPA